MTNQYINMDTDKKYYEKPAAYTDPKKIIGIVFLIMIYILGNTGCSSSNRSPYDSKSESLNPSIEYEDGSSLIVTFTASNKHLRNYTHLTFGINDIIFYVKSGNKRFVQSLTNQTLHRAAKDNNLTELDFANIADNTHLYYGVFNVPSGTIEKVEVVFSGNKTGIATDKTQFRLIDSFFNYFTSSNDPDDMYSRQVPLHVQTSSIEDINLIKNSVSVIAIDIDIDLSITPDPIKNANSNLTYALITPAISLKEIEKSGTEPAPFELAFKQFQYIDMSMGNQIDDAMAIGNQQQMLFISDYDTSAAMRLSVDSNTVDSLNEIEGLHFIDMLGTMTIDSNGYHYAVKEASILTAQKNFGMARYEGLVTDIKGNYLSLNGSRLSLKPALNTNSQQTYFKGQIPANLPQIKIGDHIILWSNDNTNVTKLLKRTTPENSMSATELLAIQSTIAFPPEDMFNIKTTKENATAINWEIGSQNCSAFITNQDQQTTKPCSNNSSTFNTIGFNKKQEGRFTIIETRQAILDQSIINIANPMDLLIHKPDTVHHFDNANAFIARIEQLVSAGGRASSMIAKGTLSKQLFSVLSAGVIVLHSQPVFDTDTSIVIADIIKEKGITAANNIAAYSKSMPFTTLSSAALVEATASMPQYLLGRNKKYVHTAIPLSQRINKNTTILYNTGIGVTKEKVPPTKATMTALPGINITADINTDSAADTNDQLMTTKDGETVILVPQAESEKKTILNGLIAKPGINHAPVLFRDGSERLATKVNPLLVRESVPLTMNVSSSVITTIIDSQLIATNETNALFEKAIDLVDDEKGYEGTLEEEQRGLTLPKRASILSLQITSKQKARASLTTTSGPDDTPQPVISPRPSNQQLLINDFKEIMTLYFDTDDQLTNTAQLEDNIRSDLTQKNLNLQSNPNIDITPAIKPSRVKAISQQLELNRVRKTRN